ncbi:hypothetical protein VB005_01806 [Metarhizium brunneum]
MDKPAVERLVGQSELEALCPRDEAMIRKAILQAAQAGVAAWRLDEVNLWEASPLGKSLVEESGLGGTWVERQEDGVACARWAGEGGDGVDEPPV